ncbi:hypothetical protein N656DRAFT_108030 [Canariomyces notabilis]|uniref:Uncharacterized protein n=1 Tax=Canariomyces notabilis TaxID=2074819 RepID=A0AAN6YS53_9PEZI|nr:hypothetical protein N656DRAFT_108030 [Canariomyces arenarius]
MPTQNKSRKQSANNRRNLYRGISIKGGSTGMLGTSSSVQFGRVDEPLTATYQNTTLEGTCDGTPSAVLGSIGRAETGYSQFRGVEVNNATFFCGPLTDRGLARETLQELREEAAMLTAKRLAAERASSTAGSGDAVGKSDKYAGCSGDAGTSTDDYGALEQPE